MINKKHISLSILLWGILLFTMCCGTIYIVAQIGFEIFKDYSIILNPNLDPRVFNGNPTAKLFSIILVIFISIPLFSVFKYWITADKKINQVMSYFMAYLLIMSLILIGAFFDGEPSRLQYQLDKAAAYQMRLFNEIMKALGLIYGITLFGFMYYTSNSKNYKKRFKKNYEYKT